MTRRLTQSAFGAVVRRHFGFLSDDDPVLDHRRAAFLATYPVPGRTVTVECWEHRDFLEVRVAEAGEDVPVASQHTGRAWTHERLERAFAEQAADLRTWLGRRA